MSEDNIREKLLNLDSYQKSNTTNFLSENPQTEIIYEGKSNGNLQAKEVSDLSDPKNLKFDGLTNMNVFGYGVGHFLNDLAAAGWFNYLTIYLKSINPIDPQNAGFYAGLVLLSGQISDGVATPLVGYLSDKTNTRIGKRMPWYIVGLVLVCVCYIFIFQKCLFCEWFDTYGEGMKMFYYVLFPSLFNVGWASLQIAHMSLVPSLSSSRMRRDKLNGLRNTFTYGANFTVLLIALILFIIIDTPITQFEVLSYLIVGIGLIASLFFLSQINEVKLSKECTDYTRKIKEYLRNVTTENEQNSSAEDRKHLHHNEQGIVEIDISKSNISGALSQDPPQIDLNEEFEIDKNTHKVKKSANLSHASLSEKVVHWSFWFREIMFYQYGLVYMCVRLVCNVTSSLFNFYLVYVIHITDADLNKSTPKELAIVPLILYVFSVIGSLALNRLYRKIGRKLTYSLGAVCIIGTSIAMIFLTKSVNWLIYPVAIINGFGQSLALNTGIVLISEVIGLKGSSGAFVFGAYSFCDKVANGIVLFFVLNSSYMEDNDPTFIRWTTVVIPAVSCLFAWIFIIAGKAKDYKVGDDQGLEDEFAQ